MKGEMYNAIYNFITQHYNKEQYDCWSWERDVFFPQFPVYRMIANDGECKRVFFCNVELNVLELKC